MTLRDVIDRTRAHRLKRRLETFGAAWRGYYDLGRISGGILHDQGKPEPALPDKWVDYNPAVSRRRREATAKEAMFIALLVGRCHGWAHAHLTDPTAGEITRGLTELHAFANRETSA